MRIRTLSSIFVFSLAMALPAIACNLPLGPEDTAALPDEGGQLSDETIMEALEQQTEDLVVPVTGDDEGDVLGVTTGLENADSPFSFPMNLALDADGNVYVADQGGERVQQVDADGNITDVNPADLEKIETENAVASANPNIGGMSQSLADQLNSVAEMAVAPNGDLFIVDSVGNRVYRVDGAQNRTVYAGNGTAGYGGDGGPATSAQLNEPRSVVVDASGNVYIADYGNQRIRRVRPDGVIETVAGLGANAEGQNN